MNTPALFDKPLPPFLLRHRFEATALINLGFAILAYLGAFALRFDFDVPPVFRATAFRFLPLLCICKIVGFGRYGLFSGWWRYVSVQDTEDIIRANLLGTGLFFVASWLLSGHEGFPRSVFLVDFLLCTAMISGTRVAIRLMRERDRSIAVSPETEKTVLIVGAGSAGIRLLDEIAHRPGGRTRVAGFIDDDPEKQGMRIDGMPVVGTVDEIAEAVASRGIDEVLIAIPSAGSSEIRRIASRCTEAKVRSRVMPTLGDLVEGRFIYTQMREPSVDDLLGRSPIRIVSPALGTFLEGRCVLVTGAAGSIGSELCRQVASNGPGRLVMFDRHENGMFGLEAELRRRYPGTAIVPVLGDVLLRDQLRGVFSTHGPDVVFHAAAFKHVPLAEANVVETVRNNVLGTRNVVEAARESGVGRFVLISTDKAVRPSSVMGATKRIAEQTLSDLAGPKLEHVTVRFGNVLGSNGSVVPLFRDQIARGGPVTVTHPDVTRFFMTIPEAVQLVLQAATTSQSGKTLVLEMGQPVRIADLARQMIELSGFAPGLDIEIEFTGLRPGEKLTEELLDDGEAMVPSGVPRVSMLVCERGARPLRAQTFLPRFAALVETGDEEGILRLMKECVPSYRAARPMMPPFGDEEARISSNG